MNDHAYPIDWAKPRFFFGQKVSLKYLPDSSLWWGTIRGMYYSHVSNLWTYEVLLSPLSELLESTETS